MHIFGWLLTFLKCWGLCRHFSEIKIFIHLPLVVQFELYWTLFVTLFCIFFGISFVFGDLKNKGMDNDVTSCTNVKAQLILTSYPWIKKKGWKTFEKKIENKKNNKNKEKKWELKENHGECECEKKGNGFLGFKSLLCESSRALCFLFPLVFTLHYEPDPITTWIVSLIWNCWKFVWVELIVNSFVNMSIELWFECIFEYLETWRDGEMSEPKLFENYMHMQSKSLMDSLESSFILFFFSCYWFLLINERGFVHKFWLGRTVLKFRIKIILRKKMLKCGEVDKSKFDCILMLFFMSYSCILIYFIWKNSRFGISLWKTGA